eukprot:10349678-Alexandrium_andersonii.AAC.1
MIAGAPPEIFRAHQSSSELCRARNPGGRLLNAEHDIRRVAPRAQRLMHTIVFGSVSLPQCCTVQFEAALDFVGCLCLAALGA